MIDPIQFGLTLIAAGVAFSIGRMFPKAVLYVPDDSEYLVYGGVLPSAVIEQITRAADEGYTWWVEVDEKIPTEFVDPVWQNENLILYDAPGCLDSNHMWTLVDGRFLGFKSEYEHDNFCHSFHTCISVRNPFLAGFLTKRQS